MVHPAQRQFLSTGEKRSFQRAGFAAGIAPADCGEARDPVAARLLVHVVMAALARRRAGKHEHLRTLGDGLGRAKGLRLRQVFEYVEAEREIIGRRDQPSTNRIAEVSAPDFDKRRAKVRGQINPVHANGINSKTLESRDVQTGAAAPVDGVLGLEASGDLFRDGCAATGVHRVGSAVLGEERAVVNFREIAVRDRLSLSQDDRILRRLDAGAAPTRFRID